MTIYNPRSDTFRHNANIYDAEELFSPNCDIPLLRKHLEWVEVEAQLPKEERRWDQNVWAKIIEQGENYCDSYRCLAGNVVYEAGGRFVPASYDNPWTSSRVFMPGAEKSVLIDETAKELLGITQLAADLLFDGANALAVIRPLCEAIAGEPL